VAVTEREQAGAPESIATTDIARIFREQFGRSVATLMRLFGDIDLAEDAVQEAFEVALRRWPVDGPPSNPGGWITTTARNRAIDRLRRAKRERELLRESAAVASEPAMEASEDVDVLHDDRLRLIFTCCHPALGPDAQVALTLRLLGGLATADVARAFLVPEATMAKRLTRAKHKIKAAQIPYRVPADHELPERLPPVLSVVYLIYNSGLDARADSPLCAEAIRLARLLGELMPDEPEVAGLVALVLLIEARRASRTGPDGSLVLLADQDRSGWDRSLIEEGHAIVRSCLRRNQPGPFQIQAAIQAVHTAAPTFEATDWPQIVALYDQLYALAPTPVVALNRAIAVGEVEGASAALELVDRLDLAGYHPFHAARADLLSRVGNDQLARLEYQRAAELAPTEAEREFLEQGGRTGRSAVLPRRPADTGGGSARAPSLPVRHRASRA
jgi:RNA polymerase sigma-70 factor (ECF subfamily)